MATRDVQLVIRARDEASAALAKISGLLGTLDIKQKGTAASGTSLASSLAETVVQMAEMERVTGLVVGASNRAEQAIDRQRAAVAGTASELASVTQQLAAARGIIDRQQREIVATLFKGGDATAQVDTIKQVRAAAADLEGQEQRLTRTLTAQQGVLEQQEANFRELAANANTAEAALASFGDEAARANLKAAAASQKAAAEAAQSSEAQRAAAAKSFFDVEPELKGSTAAAKTLLAEQLRIAEAAEETEANLRRQIAAEEELGRAAQARAFFAQERAGPVNTAASETALADLLRAEEQQEQALKRLQDRLDPAAVITRKLAADTRLLEKALEDGKIDLDQYRKALDSLETEAQSARDALTRVGRGEKGRIEMFGLKPYELTNLGYQVNDLVTQVASGTPILQAFAQQGGQILQLLPNIGANIIAAFKSPPILIAAAAVGAFAVVLTQAAQEAERLRRIEALLTTIGDGSGEAAEELAGVARELENIGLTADEAVGLVRTFLTEGLNTDYLRDFGEAAKDLASVTGSDLPDALERQRNAFTAGYEAVAELDNAIQFLTVAEREQIRAMFESGDAAGAREKAFAIYRDRMDDIAAKSRGAWSNAAEKLNRSFNDLLDTLGETQFAQDFVEAMETVVEGVEDAFTRIEDANLQFVERRIKDLEEIRKKNPAIEGATSVTLFGGPTIDQELAQLRARRQELLKQRDAAGDLRDEEADASRKRESDILRQIQQENSLANARTSAQRIALEGEKAYQEAVNAGHSQRVAQARREQAIARQRREEARREEQERKQREAGFADAIANNGRDALVGTARRFVGRNENNRGDAQVLSDLFKAANVNIDPKMVAWCAAFVNAVLATNGLPTVDQATGGSDLRARDFLGYGSEVTKPEPGDIVILKRGGGGQGHVGFFQGFANNGDVRVLGGNQSNGVNTQTFSKKDVLGFRRAPSAGDVAEEQFKAEEKRLEAQRKLNDAIDEENEERRRAAGFAAEQAALTGEALIDAQREQAVQEALAKARQQAKREGETDLDISEDRLKAIRETVEAEFDLARARDRASAALDDAGGVRDALLSRLDQVQAVGDTDAAAEIEAQIAQIDDVLRGAIERAIQFWQTLGPDNPTARAAIIGLGTQLRDLDIDRTNRAQQRAEQPVSDFQAQRNALQEQIGFYNELGDTAVVEQLREQLRAVDEQLLGAIDTAVAFWQTQTGPEAQAALLQFENLRNQVLAAQNEFVITAGQIQDAFAGSLIDGFRTFAEVLVETRDPLQALAQGALQFAADFTRKLAEMGLELLAFKLATKLGFGGFADTFNSALGAGTMTASATALGAAGASVAAGGTAVTAGAAALGVSAAALQAAASLLLAANSASVLHGGGIVGGTPNRSRAVSPLWFAAATRYHSGGIAGLRPNEVPAILERGEEVITRSDARHRLNGGAGGSETGGNTSISQILAIGEDQIASALRSASGRRVVLTHIEQNRETIRTMLNE